MTVTINRLWPNPGHRFHLARGAQRLSYSMRGYAFADFFSRWGPALRWQWGRGAGTGFSRVLADPYSGLADGVG